MDDFLVDGGIVHTTRLRAFGLCVQKICYLFVQRATNSGRLVTVSMKVMARNWISSPFTLMVQGPIRSTATSLQDVDGASLGGR